MSDFGQSQPSIPTDELLESRRSESNHLQQVIDDRKSELDKIKAQAEAEQKAQAAMLSRLKLETTESEKVLEWTNDQIKASRQAVDDAGEEARNIISNAQEIYTRATEKMDQANERMNGVVTAEKRLGEQSAEHSERLTELDRQVEEIRLAQIKNIQIITALSDREEALDRREDSLKNREQEAENRDMALRNQKTLLDAREGSVAAREGANQATTTDVERREDVLASWTKVANKRDEAADQREAELNDRSAEQDRIARQQKAQAEELQLQSEELAASKIILDRRQRIFDAANAQPEPLKKG